MGRAKAWLPWRGRPMIEHVVESLRAGGAVDEVVVVTSAELDLPRLEARLVRDRAPALGPLAGIREGLAHMKAERAYATSTDAPFLTERFVRAMLAHGDAAAPEVDGFVQTLAAVYPRRALSIAEELLTANRLRPLHLLEAVGYRKVAAAELPDLESLRGFNSPDEYLVALAQTSPDGTALIELRGAARQAAPHSEVEVPVGTLAQVLAQLPDGAKLLDGGGGGGDTPLRLAAAFAASLGGRESLRDSRVPIGPGERVIVEDAA
jgi:molybdopterin-guanine dinucleotide biosynthesis protein A